MLPSAAPTVQSYLAALPEARRQPLAKLRQLILRRLPAGFEECMEYGMISYVVPLSRYPETYNGKPLALASLASQKQYMALYLMSVYGNLETKRWLSEGFRRAGKRLDMGKACVRFRALEDLPLDVIGDVIARVSVDEYLAAYERARGLTSKARANGAGPIRQPAAGNAPAKKKAAPARKVAKKVGAKKKARLEPVGKQQASRRQASKKKRRA